jgi:hypothetical protein
MLRDSLSPPHAPPNEARHIYRWYRNAQINYVEHYVRLFICYNAWYRQVTNSTNDREALAQLKKRFVIWNDYANGHTLQQMKPYVKRVVEYSRTYPLPANAYWSGIVEDAYDWKGLIEYWYHIRCLLVHGEEVALKHVWLAYETLDAFMSEIITRMKTCFTDADNERLEEVMNLATTEYAQTDKFKLLQQKLHEKYIKSPNIWQVNMQRATLI